MIIKNWKRDVFTVPNLLSVVRLLMIPVYMSIYLLSDSLTNRIVAGTIMSVSCITDMIDGMIARIAAELDAEPAVLLTGGGAEKISPLLTSAHDDLPYVTLRGLRIIWQKNKG